MKRFALALPLFYLAACDSGPSVEADNAKPSEVAQKVSEAGVGSFVSAGQWETTVTIDKMEMPGLPAEYAEKINSRVAKARTVKNCLTPADVKRPKADFFAADKSCQYDHFEMSGGKIDATMRCEHGGIAQSMTMQGSYTADEYHMTTTSKTEGAGPQAGMTTTVHIDAKRIGDCDGKENVQLGN